VKEQNAGCCLGHFIHQTTKCAWSKLNILPTPENYYTKANKKNPLVIEAVYHELGGSFSDIANSPFACRAMGINDCLNINDEQREEELKDLFFSEGYILEFYN